MTFNRDIYTALFGLLHTEMVYPPEDGSPIQVVTGPDAR